jgi:hypothetical protein
MSKKDSRTPPKAEKVVEAKAQPKGTTTKIASGNPDNNPKARTDNYGGIGNKSLDDAKETR